jgi:hypothetical protein
MTGRTRLPNRRACEHFSFQCNGLNYTESFDRFPDGSLAEIFISNSKAGSHSDSGAEDAAAAASIALQHGISLDVIRQRLAARLARRCQFAIRRCARPRGGGRVMIRCINRCRFEKNTLKEFADLALTSVGLVLRDCTWHRHADGKEWGGFPARSYQDQNGETKWQPLVAGRPTLSAHPEPTQPLASSTQAEGISMSPSKRPSTAYFGRCTVRLAPLVCAYCQHKLRAHEVEPLGDEIRLICPACHRDILAIEE